MLLKKALVFHTAFIGDVILALPVVQRLHEAFPQVAISFVAIPAAAAALENHPDIAEVISYDKRGKDSGPSGVLKLAASLRDRHFDVAVVPHRSFRSALVIWLARIPNRVGFSTSGAPWFFTDIVRYDRSSHEIERNLSLLEPLGVSPSRDELPLLYPSTEDERIVERFLPLHDSRKPAFRRGNLLGFAPGSVWNTKRWPREHFIQLGKRLVADGFALVLLGSGEDADLCSGVEQSIGSTSVLNAAGKLTVLQSAALIRRCSVLISNDSAPMHLAVGVGTPVVALFGPTVPRFGFAPRGKYDVVAEVPGLECRPCSIHGGEECPIKTFVCMQNLEPEDVHGKVKDVIESAGKGRSDE